MDWLIWGIIGWCGTRWPWHIGGGGGGDTDPWPPNCWVCGGLIGFVAAILVAHLTGLSFAANGILTTTVVALASGKVGRDIVGTAIGMARG